MWEDFVDALKATADAAADVVAGVVNEVGDVVADVVETVGNLAQDALGAVANVLSAIPGIGPVLAAVLRWVGGIYAGLMNLQAGGIKHGIGIIAGVLGGVIRILIGALTLSGDLILKGLVDIGSSILGGIVLVAGQTVSLVQRVLYFPQGQDRALTKDECDMLRKVFERSLALYNIRVIEGGAGVLGIPDRRFTLGNTIYMLDADLSDNPNYLVHECVHVWQYQNTGSRYTTDALGAQAFYGENGQGAYKWEDELARGTSRWWNFNAEAQAEFMEDVWQNGSLTVNGNPPMEGEGAFFGLKFALIALPDGATAAFEASDGTDLTDFANESIEDMRGRINLRLSQILA